LAKESKKRRIAQLRVLHSKLIGVKERDEFTTINGLKVN